MKRNTGALLLASTILFVGLMTIPITHADSVKDSTRLANKAAPIPALKVVGLTDPIDTDFIKQQTPEQNRTITPKVAGQPSVLNSGSALSAAIMTTFGGRGTQFSDVTLLADWDGREDYAADRGQKLDDF